MPTSFAPHLLPLLPPKHTSCVQLVFSSTCAVYGNPAKLPVTEETPALPINPYGRAKLVAEQAIKDYLAAEPALSAVIFRCLLLFVCNFAVAAVQS